MDQLDLGDQRTFLRLHRGELVMATLQSWMKQVNLAAASVQAIGAVEAIELGYYDVTSKQYSRIEIPESHELLALVGNLGWGGEAGEPIVHLHATLGGPDFSVRGGHLFEARVSVVVETIVERSPNRIVRDLDPETGLKLVRCEC